MIRNPHVRLAVASRIPAIVTDLRRAMQQCGLEIPHKVLTEIVMASKQVTLEKK